ncbi:MAG: hypothetical protein V5789_04965, partial [Colwellia sp.]
MLFLFCVIALFVWNDIRFFFSIVFANSAPNLKLGIYKMSNYRYQLGSHVYQFDNLADVMAKASAL